jgi:hypothetical protein
MPLYEMTRQELLRSIEVFFYKTFPFHIFQGSKPHRKIFRNIIRESTLSGVNYKRDYGFIDFALNVIENDILCSPDTRDLVLTLWFNHVPISIIRNLLALSEERVWKYLDDYELNKDWITPVLEEGSRQKLIGFMNFCEKFIFSNTVNHLNI